jgi:predicted Fe-Mo cluster-binding NifX family protein
MKIAIPVKMNRENPPLAPLFGKAKWFAIIENDGTEIVQNMQKGGRAVIDWLDSMNVNTIIFQEMGHAPYEMIKEAGGMELFHAGYERVLLDDVLVKFKNNVLEKVDDRNIGAIIRHHEGKHSH